MSIILENRGLRKPMPLCCALFNVHASAGILSQFMLELMVACCFSGIEMILNPRNDNLYVSLTGLIEHHVCCLTNTNTSIRFGLKKNNNKGPKQTEYISSFSLFYFGFGFHGNFCEENTEMF